MKQNSQSKLQQALGDKKMWERVASSPDAKALAGMKSLIQSISSTPGGAELLQRLGNSFGQK